MSETLSFDVNGKRYQLEEVVPDQRSHAIFMDIMRQVITFQFLIPQADICLFNDSPLHRFNAKKEKNAV